MKTFEKKTKPATSPVRRRRTPVLPFFDPTAQSQRAQIRQVLRSPQVQAKLTIGQPGDKYEQEADRVADEVMRMPEPRLQRQPEEEEEEELIQTKPLAEQITPLVQRQVEEEEEEILQTKEASGQTPEVTSDFESGIQSLKGGGQLLPKSVRTFFEPRFGVDFSNVRVHDDTRAASVTRSVNARAFTFGRNIVFGAGEYSPDISSGKKLLAHELTHVMQQNGAPTPFTTGKNSENTIPNSPEFAGRYAPETREGKRLLAHELTHVVQQTATDSTNSTIHMKSKTKQIVENVELKNIPFYEDPKLYIYFESAVFESLRENLNQKIPKSWAPDLMSKRTDLKTSVYFPSMNMATPPKSLTLLATVVLGQSWTNSRIYFYIKPLRGPSIAPKKKGEKPKGEKAKKGEVSGLIEEKSKSQFSDIKHLERINLILELAEPIAVILKTISHFLPLAIVGPILGPIVVLVSGVIAIKTKKHAGYLKGVELGFMVARELEKENPGLCLRKFSSFSAENLEKMATRYERTRKEGFYREMESIKVGGEHVIEGMRIGFKTVEGLLAHVRAVAAAESTDRHWKEIEVIQREVFLGSCEQGIETTRNLRGKLVMEKFNL